ncbi:MAG: DNA polymerase III subunit delta, partial [Planctomycetota bacterium]
PFITRYRKQLEAYCAAPTGGGCLILVCNSLPRNTRLYRAIAASGEVIECRPPGPQQVGSWIVQRGRDACGKQVDRAAAARLRELVGNDLGTLDNELGKLAAYVGARGQIGVADVDALVGQHREETVFRVTDAMAAGNAAGALHAWEQVLATDRAAPMRAIGGLASGIRRLLEAKQAVAAGTPVRALVPRFGRDPGLLARRLDSVTIEHLKEQLCDLYETDLATKTGLADVDRAVETFVVKHTASPGAVARTEAGGKR